jgi:homoserine kinase type II
MAVYTDVSFEELETLLADYDLGQPLSFKGIAEGVENSNFALSTDKSHFILTLYEKRVREGDLPFFLGLMEHLSTKGISCPLPVRSKSGALWTSLNRRPAALLTYLNGLSLRRPEAAHCDAVGRALAELHAAGADFALRRPNALSIGSWRELASTVLEGADGVQAGLRALIEDALKGLEASWPTGLPSGVIHADLFPDNVLFMNNQVSGLIDFYFACDDAYAYDLAVMLNAWCFENDGAYNITKGRALLTAYQKQRALSLAEREAFPILARGSALRFLLTRLYDLINHDPMALVRPKDPRDFAKRLRFHEKVRSAGEYGL